MKGMNRLGSPETFSLYDVIQILPNMIAHVSRHKMAI